METLEQVLERLKANSQKLELLMKKVMLLAGDMKSEELEKMKKEIDEEQDRILAAMWKFKDEAAKKLS